MTQSLASGNATGVAKQGELSLSPALTSHVRPHPLKSPPPQGISPPLSLDVLRLLSYCFVHGVLSALYCELLTPDVDISLELERMVSLCTSCLSGGVQWALSL